MNASVVSWRRFWIINNNLHYGYSLSDRLMKDLILVLFQKKKSEKLLMKRITGSGTVDGGHL